MCIQNTHTNFCYNIIIGVELKPQAKPAAPVEEGSPYSVEQLQFLLGLALVLGFVFMLLIDQCGGGHSHNHSTAGEEGGDVHVHIYTHTKCTHILSLSLSLTHTHTHTHAYTHCAMHKLHMYTNHILCFQIPESHALP